MAYRYDDRNVFARILRGEIPNRTVLETEHCLAFHDIRPRAEVHVLVIPKGPFVNFDHFGAAASDAEIIDFTRTVAAACARLGVGRRRLQAGRQFRPRAPPGGLAHASAHPRRPQAGPDAAGLMPRRQFALLHDRLARE